MVSNWSVNWVIYHLVEVAWDKLSTIWPVLWSTIANQGSKCAPSSVSSDVSLGFQYEPGGTTAVVVLVKDKRIFCVSWVTPFHPCGPGLYVQLWLGTRLPCHVRSTCVLSMIPEWCSGVTISVDSHKLWTVPKSTTNRPCFTCCPALRCAPLLACLLHLLPCTVAQMTVVCVCTSRACLLSPSGYSWCVQKCRYQLSEG